MRRQERGGEGDRMDGERKGRAGEMEKEMDGERKSVSKERREKKTRRK